MLSAARRQQQTLHLQKKMQSRSKEFLLDITLLSSGQRKSLQKVAEKSNFSTEYYQTKQIDTINPNEIKIATAIGEVRVHNTASEPYFWEQVYGNVSP